MQVHIDKLLGTLSQSFGESLPKVLVAILLLIVGLFIAKALRRLIRRGLEATGIDQKIDPNNSSKFTLADSLSKIIYWVMLMYLFLFILNMVGVSGALTPLQDMIAKITGFLPNILGAGLIGFIGYMIANIGKEAVGLLSGGINTVSNKLGISSDFNVMGLLRQIVFLVIFIPIILIALDTLNISTISDPAKAMLTKLFDAIPNIIAAGLILFIFTFGGKFVMNVVRELLDNMKVDMKMRDLGVGNIIGNTSFSKLISQVLYYFIVFFGLVTAVEKLQFTQLSNVLNEIMGLSGHILFGMIILLIGNQISKYVSSYFEKSDSPTLGSISRFATLGLFLAIALRYMGIADDIVNLAFGLTLGAVAVAFALAFGLGAREEAGRQATKFFNKFDK